MKKILKLVKRMLMFFWIKSSFFWSNLFRRRNIEITKMKNLHLGQRVFIVATGPSLTFEDLEMIKNEFSISMNSIVKVLNDTNYRPSYYLIQDKEVCDSLTSLINSSNLECVFLGMGNSYCLKGNLG